MMDKDSTKTEEKEAIEVETKAATTTRDVVVVVIVKVVMTTNAVEEEAVAVKVEEVATKWVVKTREEGDKDKFLLNPS